ncbi:MAG: TonB family protein [Gammaproteobacteria bacterium]|nr:TonB family protein [Gammaproteobacteria bacterium]
MANATAISTAIPLARVTPGDRLGFTVFVALVAHAIVILGIGFTPTDKLRLSRSSMEVILVPTKTEKPPEKAEYLAQVSQDGGGDSNKKERPSTPAPAPFVSKRAVVPAVAPPAQPARPAPTKPTPKNKRVLVRKKAPIKVKAKPKPIKKTKSKPVKKPLVRPVPQVKAVGDVSKSVLFAKRREVDSLNTEINRKLRAYAERPWRTFINARTREFKYAAYMEAWRAKVERVGNLNYPDEARRKKLSGSLVLDVSLNPDGSIDEIILRRSSGHKTLDDAAIGIVKLAAPFARFPAAIRRETDILHIERTWQFLGSNRLFAR